MIFLKEPMQPAPESWRFVKELSEPTNRHFNWTRTAPKKHEADLNSGVCIRSNFPDPQNHLKTAYKDLDDFFETAQISLDGNYKIIIEKIDTPCFEAYRLDIGNDSCHIQANDTEGIRRAVYYLEDLLLSADGAFLPTGIISRKPWLKSRISRCFFGPIKRPPFNRDELLDDIDYYPDEYLNHLAHEGVNGLWLTIAFSDLCQTSISKLESKAEKRLEKLRATVKKCLRYGIKTYIFCIEPRAMAPDNQVLLNNPILKGPLEWDDKHCFCPFSETAQNYLYESTNWIFSKVPGLGGMINISFGERSTTCLSHHFGVSCPVCSRKTPGEIINAALEPMKRGMQEAAPEAELISWLYVPQNGTGVSCDEQMLDVADKLPEDVILQYNFESSGGKEQLGKYRHAGDYWLSYVGPSNIFKELSKTAKFHDNAISAKIQVGCSHEVATVPFVPVPGLLYRKYKAMHKLGVSHVMQCWYFGNYPGIMNKAAGELAFEDFKDTETDFLQRLAAPQWGNSTDKIVKSWQLLADGYANYPLDNMFQYYGPMHDGVVWPLHLLPADTPLAPTWRLDYGTSGDRYGECLGTFAIEEILALCKELSAQWHKGADIQKELLTNSKVSQECLKDIALVEALDIQFQSGLNILEFYALRDELLNVSGKSGIEIIEKMKLLVMGEIKNSTRMIELSQSDSRLGFHPEAEGYKYFPEKLSWRVKLLHNLLKDDFPQIRNRLIKGEKAFAETNIKSYICNSGKYEYTAGFSWKADYRKGKLKITIDAFDNKEESEFKIFLETRPFYQPQVITEKVKKKIEIEVPLNTSLTEIGFNIIKTSHSEVKSNFSGWVNFLPIKQRLVLGDYNPNAKGKLIIKENMQKEAYLQTGFQQENVQVRF